MTKKCTAEEIETRAKGLNPLLSLVKETYVDTHTKCLWVEEGFGEFSRTPKNVITRRQLHHPSSMKARKEDTNLNTYGFKNPFQAPGPQAKQLKTVRSQFGVDNVSQLDWVKQQKIDTCQKNFGVDYYLQSPENMQCTQNTNLQRYGYKNPMTSKLIQKRYSDRCFAKHGVRWFPQTEIFKDKCRQTNMARRGVESSMHDPHVRAKAAATKLKNGSYYRSKAERQLLAYMKETVDPDARSTSTSFKGTNFQIDIFLPSRNVCIEYNGMFWHSEGNRDMHPAKHLHKTLGCGLQGRRLVHIWETEWSKKQRQVKSYLKAVSGVFDRRVVARKCQIIELTDKTQVKDFLEANHLLGSCTYTTALGITKDGELLGVALLGKHHRKFSHGNNVVKRFAFLAGVQVVGGMSKLTKHLFDYTKADHLITWAEIRLGAETSYSKAGWTAQATSRPDYFYWHDNKKIVFSKQSRKASHKGTGLTEHQKALEDGLLRIYDCGKVRFVTQRP